MILKGETATSGQEPEQPQFCRFCIHSRKGNLAASVFFLEANRCFNECKVLLLLAFMGFERKSILSDVSEVFDVFDI